ncbi:hypothetical protein AV530_004397 [Patagioenas fasciata monilis]|uniref:Uncharacterized protein n=1 Tax=Patagioenas fasciata monilis TaxID=372326 RepID=A0A1V4J1V4_PATFA|nr:hypothetical protein AV530_004397 [Patagioenas fasciata monilis]
MPTRGPECRGEMTELNERLFVPSARLRAALGASLSRFSSYPAKNRSPAGVPRIITKKEGGKKRRCSHTSPAPGDAPVHLRLLLWAPWLLQDEEEERRGQRGAGDGGVRSRAVCVPCCAPGPRPIETRLAKGEPQHGNDLVERQTQMLRTLSRI